MSDDEFEFLVRVAKMDEASRHQATETMEKPDLSPLATDVLGGLLGLPRTASATKAWMTEIIRAARQQDESD